MVPQTFSSSYLTGFMETLKFAVLPGDGIGPEVMTVALRVLEQAGQRFGFRLDATHADIGG
ncbi:uncharacterized protein METZ01_LOCUS293909, partial [marine metagenome]